MQQRITIAEYARMHRVSETTARKRLEALRQAGDATMVVTWQHPQDSKCFSHAVPPAHRVHVYIVEE